MPPTPSQHTPEFIYGELVRLLNIPQNYLRPAVNSLCIELLRKEMSFNPRMFEFISEIANDAVEAEVIWAYRKEARQIIGEIEGK